MFPEKPRCCDMIASCCLWNSRQGILFRGWSGGGGWEKGPAGSEPVVGNCRLLQVKSEVQAAWRHAVGMPICSWC